MVASSKHVTVKAPSARRSHDNVTVSIETITPEMAQEILGTNPKNFRKLSENRAKGLADVMRRGEFRFNGEKILIRSDGSVADGQTRLRACVISGVPFKTVVVRGDVEDESNLDTGSKRTAGQLLQFHNVPNANSMAAAIKAYLALFVHSTKGHLAYATPITPAEVFQFSEKNPQMQESVRLGYQAPVGLYQALVAAVHFAGMQIDPKHTEWWINALLTGENLTEKDPVLRLRNKFLRNTKRTLMSRTEMSALLIKSWNLSREGATVEALIWRGSGPNPEEFPVLGGGEEGAAPVHEGRAGRGAEGGRKSAAERLTETPHESTVRRSAARETAST